MLPDTTRILTSQGFLTPSQLTTISGKSPKFLSPETGAWVNGYAEYVTKSFLYTYTLAPATNTHGSRTWLQQATRPTRFPLKLGDTYDLREGDILPANGWDCGYSATAWGQGFMYRLGLTSVDSLEPERFPKLKNTLLFLKETNQLEGRPTIPKPDDSVETKGSFIKGYLAAEGNSGLLTTANKELFSFFEDNAGLAGCVLTGASRTIRKSLKVEHRTEFYDQFSITYAKGGKFSGFKVKEIVGPVPQKTSVYEIHTEADTYVVEGGWCIHGDN